VSQSGGSPDLTEVVRAARGSGACTLSLTNAPHSPVAHAAEMHIDLLAGAERAVAATKSYTAQLLSLYLLVESIAGRDGAEAEALPRRAREVLAREDEIARLATRYRFAEQI